MKENREERWGGRWRRRKSGNKISGVVYLFGCLRETSHLETESDVFHSIAVMRNHAPDFTECLRLFILPSTVLDLRLPVLLPEIARDFWASAER